MAIKFWCKCVIIVSIQKLLCLEKNKNLPFMVGMPKLIKQFWILCYSYENFFLFEIHLGFSFPWHLHEQMGCYKAPRCRVNVHACATRAGLEIGRANVQGEHLERGELRCDGSSGEMTPWHVKFRFRQILSNLSPNVGVK